MVWECCLPSRVVDFVDRHRDSPWRRRRPVISQVCRLSRYIALLHGGEVSLSHTRFWFNAKTDIVDFNRISYKITGIDDTFRIPHIPSSLANAEELLPCFLLHPEIEGRLSDPKVKLSIDHRYFRVFFPRSVNGQLWALVVTRLMEVHKECFVTLAHVEVSLSRRRACESGLFGLFAEQDVAYVDIDNLSQVSNLQRVLDTMRRPVQGKPIDILCLRLARRERWRRDKFHLRLIKANQDRYLFNFHVKIVLNSLRPMRAGLPQSSEQLPRFKFVIAVYLIEEEDPVIELY
ncbi:hypothetical protein GGR58DRAFT_484453 [Xylaria digitata]|nr:hypothetical protein GGR58DRAFT_484453 [Xylaria digitata]